MTNKSQTLNEQPVDPCPMPSDSSVRRPTQSGNRNLRRFSPPCRASRGSPTIRSGPYTSHGATSLSQENPHHHKSTNVGGSPPTEGRKKNASNRLEWKPDVSILEPDSGDDEIDDNFCLQDEDWLNSQQERSRGKGKEEGKKINEREH